MTCAARLTSGSMKAAGLLVAGWVVVAGTFPAAAQDNLVPAEFLGRWSATCGDPGAAQVWLSPITVTVVSDGREDIYSGIDVSRTWEGGVKATGGRVWLLVSKEKTGPFDFIVELASGRSSLVITDGSPSHGAQVRHLLGTEFHYCDDDAGPKQSPDPQADARPVDTPVEAGELDVPVVEQGGDGQAANCMSSRVAGLKAGGDGFLAVRSGPGTHYAKIDALRNGETVFVFEVRGKWAGVVYRTGNVTCSSTETRPVPYARKGWVHMNWLRGVAG